MAGQSRVWRLLQSPPSTGPRNMALDEAILDGVGNGSSAPTLRLYAWSPPCLSLGYAQSIADVDFERLHRLGWDFVRRPTGGRAILHAEELTYAVVGPPSDPDLRGGVLESYLRISRGLVAALEDLGAESLSRSNGGTGPLPGTEPICFENPGPYEILAEGRKLMGSAQVRRKNAVLQHGSLPLGGDLARICQVLRYPQESGREEASRRVRAKAATLEDVFGRPIRWGEAAQAMRSGFQRALGVQLLPGVLTLAEQERAALLEEERYAVEAWSARR